MGNELPPIDPISMIRPRRKVAGMSAVLLPFDENGAVDWPSFRAHLRRTVDAGLIPAVNMDTGFVSLIDFSTRERVLHETRGLLAGKDFVAAAFVDDRPGDSLNLDGYRRAVAKVQQFGGLPIVFQSFGLSQLKASEVIEAYGAIARECDRFLAFELGPQFAPFGRIYEMEIFTAMLGIRSCVGVKHSSLDRGLEWQRLAIRDKVRPEFQILTGNDLAIDMIMYGSDYLLGLSTFAPDLFAKRDRLWETGDPSFFELNDVLQYLGFFAFRPPVPAYKHSAAQFLRLRGWLPGDRTHPKSARRPDSDRDVLRDIAGRLDPFRS